MFLNTHCQGIKRCRGDNEHFLKTWSVGTALIQNWQNDRNTKCEVLQKYANTQLAGGQSFDWWESEAAATAAGLVWIFPSATAGRRWMPHNPTNMDSFFLWNMKCNRAKFLETLFNVCHVIFSNTNTFILIVVQFEFVNSLTFSFASKHILYRVRNSMLFSHCLQAPHTGTKICRPIAGKVFSVLFLVSPADFRSSLACWSSLR